MGHVYCIFQKICNFADYSVIYYCWISCSRSVKIIRSNRASLMKAMSIEMTSACTCLMKEIHFDLKSDYGDDKNRLNTSSYGLSLI